MSSGQAPDPPRPSEAVRPTQDSSSPAKGNDEPTEVVVEALARLVATQTFGPVESPVERALAEHMTPEIIREVLDITRLRETNRHAEVIDKSRNRPWVVCLIVFLFLLFVVVLSWLAFYYGNGALILPIVSVLIVIVTTAFGAYSYGRLRQKNDDAKE